MQLAKDDAYEVKEIKENVRKAIQKHEAVIQEDWVNLIFRIVK